METKNLIRNVPTPEGIKLGEQMARFADKSEVADYIAAHPNARERCKTCAFRKGTLPNGCPATLMDAVKCLIEDHDFNCHENTEQICAGFLHAKIASADVTFQGKVPWDFSYESA